MMDAEWHGLSRLAIKAIALLITLLIAGGISFLLRHRVQDFGSVFTKTQTWLMYGGVALLIGITVYYS